MQQQPEQEVYQEVLTAHLVEQRRSRRWGIFFKLLFFGYILAISLVFPKLANETGIKEIHNVPHAAVVDLYGVISANSKSSAKAICKRLTSAFKNKNSKGVLLRINSPGGSPVQSNMIYKHILRLKQQYPDKPIYSVIEDVGASAAYLIACATDKIYADESSFVGSIGVIYQSFGFDKLIDKIGIDRRVYTSGSRKLELDNFSPENPKHVATLKNKMNLVHNEFIKKVKLGRKGKISSDQNVFDGSFYVGINALKKGLIDGFADIKETAAHELKVDTLIEYTAPKNPLAKLLQGVKTTLVNTLFSPEFN